MTTPVFRDVERQARRMGEVIHRLDVDTLKLACVRGGDGYVQARTTCFDCSNVTRCLQWLEASSPETGRPTFCPNLPLFEECKKR